MKPRDEFAALVAGSVTADQFILEWQGNTVAEFGTDDTGPFPIHRLDFISPEWVAPDVESHFRWSGQGDNGSQIEIGTTNLTDDVRAELDLSASPGFRSSAELGVDQGLGHDSRLTMWAGTDGSGDYSTITLQSRVPSGPDVVLALSASDSAGESTVNITADYMNLPRNNMVPTGSIVMGIWATSQPGFLLLDGSAIASASTLFPELWAVAPASWKSGTTLNLPNMSDRFARGVTGTPGATGGANTHTLAAVNLPPHSHTIAHDHDSGHGINAGSQSPLGAGNSWAFPGGASNRVTGPSTAPNSGNGPGSSTAVTHRPAYLDVRFMVKT